MDLSEIFRECWECCILGLLLGNCDDYV